MRMRAFWVGGLALGICSAGAWAEQGPLTVTPAGGVMLLAGEAGATQLSGLSYVSGDEWLAVSDTTGELFRLTIALNPGTGAIMSAGVVSGLELAGAADLEGVAYDPTTGTAWVSDEIGPAIRRHDLTSGAVVQTLSLPAVFDHVDGDRSLESLTRDPATGALWTANEEALTVDGSRSTTEAGTVVRLQKFDATGAPVGQWAYVTDPISADSPLITQERSGVSDLVALPDGRLLVLERELGGSFLPDYRSAIYLVDFDGATDVSSLAGLIGQSYAPVGKTLLWKGDFQFENYEGIGLGPVLEDGSISLLLISDDGGNDLMEQRVYALRISGVVPEPGAMLPGFGMLMGYALHRTRRLANRVEAAADRHHPAPATD